MKLTTETRADVTIVRVQESRMMYPLLNEFASTVTGLITSGTRKVVIDLSGVGYIDSATIGCLMDLYRQMNAAGGAVRLAGVQKRVETMLTMTGALNFLQAHPDEAGAVASFGGAA
jgi:anti-sigma B factor antagonist